MLALLGLIDFYSLSQVGIILKWVYLGGQSASATALKSTHSLPYRELLARMRAAREASGITQEALAKRLGKPQSYVSKAEQGERRLDVVEFLQFMRAIEGEPHALLREIEREYRIVRSRPERKRR